MSARGLSGERNDGHRGNKERGRVRRTMTLTGGDRQGSGTLRHLLAAAAMIGSLVAGAAEPPPVAADTVAADTAPAAAAVEPELAAPPDPAVHEIDLRTTTAAQVAAMPEPEPAPPPTRVASVCGSSALDDEAFLDETRRRVESIVCSSTVWFDSLFGERDVSQKHRRVEGSIELSQTYSEFYGGRNRLRFDARFDLPNLNRRFSGFIGRENDDDFISDRLDNSALRARFPQVDDRDRWLAGLGYSLPSRHSLRSSFRIGVRGLAHPEAFAQNRVMYTPYSDDHNLINLRLTPFWTTRDGFGVTAGGDYSHVLTPTRLIRLRSVGTLSEITAGVSWRSSLTLFHAVELLDGGIAYETYVRGSTDHPVSIRDYGVQTIFRHPFARRRLYGEWIVGYSFPRDTQEQAREGSWLGGIGVEMPFGVKASH